MPVTFLLLQLVNAGLAGASLYLHFQDPGAWDGQALVLSVLAGVLLASFTAIFLGIAMVFSREARPLSIAIHLLLTLAFAGAQIWLLYQLGQDMGLINYLRSKLAV